MQKTILVINKYCPLHPKAGGAEKNLVELFSRIAETHEVTLLAARFPGAPQEERYRNIRIIRIGSPRSENVIRIHLLLPIALGNYLRRIRPDTLFEDMSVLPFFSPILHPKQKKIVMAHGLNGRHIFSSQRFFYALAGYLAEKLFLLSYRRETVIVVSKWMRETLLARGFRNVKIVLNGVDEDFFKIKKNYAPRPTVLFLGRLEGRKGIDILLRTFPLVRKSIPSVRYAIAGRRFYFGEPRWLKKILDRFTEGYSKDEIEFLGFVSEARKRELLSEAWILAMPSRTEGYGITAIEANATGTFVIGNDTEGLREAIQHGETGMLVDCRITEKFSKKIIEWLNKKKLESRENACKAWARTHSWDKAAQEVTKLVTS